MTFEFWVIVVISLGVSLLSSSLTSPLLWYNLLTCKPIWGDAEHKGIVNLDKFDNDIICFLKYEISITGITFFYSLVAISILPRKNGISLFSYTILTAFSIIIVSKLVRQMMFQQTRCNKFKITNSLKLLFLLFALYIIFFIYDNVMFSKVEVDKIEEVELSEEILPDTFTISNRGFINLTGSSIKTLYSSNGKLVFFNNEIDCFGLIANNQINFLECNSSNINAVPSDLLFRNPKKLGIGVSDDNHIYIVYALLRKKFLLGKYEVAEYALYDPFEEKISYSNIPPHFLN